MERDQSLNFKLLVPPRLSCRPVSATLTQGNVENGDINNKIPQGYTKFFDKEQSMPVSSTGMVAPTKPIRQGLPKMKVVPSMEKEENNCSPGQLYSKLFDEVGKIKRWKAQTDSDTAQREKRLEENKRTIETQRIALQELQFENESLSIKLEEQINENKDMRNKNNATRNLCNILKNTFERTAEKMHLFESEREETHHLFMDYSGTIQKLSSAFENLCIQAEANQQEMQKVKEDLLHSEQLKEKHFEEYNIKEKEVEVLETKLKDKENEWQNNLLELQETQNHYRLLQEATDEQYELLMSSKAQQESLLKELNFAEERCKEAEKNRDNVAAMLEETKKEFAERIQSKDLNLEELNRVKCQQAEKLEQIQTTILELNNLLALENQRTKELEDKLVANGEELEKRKTLLGETMEQSAKKDEQIKTLEEELIQMQELEVQLFNEKKKNEECTFQVEQLRKEVMEHEKKCKELLSNLDELQAEKKGVLQQFESQSARINSLQEEVEKLQRMKKDDQQRLLQELESQSFLSAEMEMLRQAAAEATKSKEDAELKCQQKIADMVALMEKHKSQYDRMVEEKAAELHEQKRKEMEALSQQKLMESDLENHKKDKGNLIQQLRIQVAEKENLQLQLTDLRREISLVKITQLQEITSKQSPASNSEKQRFSETPKENSLRSHVFNFAKTLKTPSYSNNGGITREKRDTEFNPGSIRASLGATPKIKREDLKSPKITSNTGRTPKIRTYRIRTPPGQETHWKNSMELDPKSDSSDQNDILIASKPPSKLNILQKSTMSQKSPGSSLKLAAMKRMRDAGWTAVIGCDKKKKKSEKIFA